jgi:hypothetical protein
MIAVLRSLLLQTFTDPRYALRKVLSLVPPREPRWIAAATVVILTVLLTQIITIIAPAPPGSPWEAMMGDPVRNTVTQLVFLMAAAWGMSGLARSFGGAASFDDALMAVTWVEFLLLILQIAQLVVILALPFLALPLAVLTLGLFFWLLTHFTAALNGFSSMAKTFLGVLGATVIGGLVTVFILGLTGIAGVPVAP